MALVLDLKSDWWKVLRDFAEQIRKNVGEGILKIIASPSPDDLFMDSNVLVVVDKASKDVSMAVAKAALEVNGKYESTISYMIAEKGDPTIEKFMEASTAS